jgi:hypothetical protein
VDRRLAALATAALLLVSAVACGGDSGASPPPTGPNGDLILATAARATAVKTLAFTLDVKVVDGSGRAAHLGGDGAVDNPRPLVTMNVNTQGLLAQEPFVRPMISDGRDLYLRIPDTSPPQLGDKHWVRLDRAGLAQPSGRAFDGLARRFRSHDPRGNLALLAGAAGDVAENGKQEVDGVTLRRLSVRVDLKRALATAPAAVRSSVEELVAELRVKTLPVEVEIDEEGLPRSFSYDLPASKTRIPGTRKLEERVEVSFKLSDFDKPVKAAVPSPGETVNLSELDNPLAVVGFD